jgi:hypothetical protein
MTLPNMPLFTSFFPLANLAQPLYEWTNGRMDGWMTSSIKKLNLCVIFKYSNISFYPKAKPCFPTQSQLPSKTTVDNSSFSLYLLPIYRRQTYIYWEETFKSMFHSFTIHNSHSQPFPISLLCCCPQHPSSITHPQPQPHPISYFYLNSY